MKKRLPIGVENFEKLRNEDLYYVDKTELLHELLDEWSDVRLFTRPIRFGKTLALDMIRRFFAIGEDKSLFDGLSISRDRAFCEKYQGKFPVISISLKSVDGMTFEDAKNRLFSLIEEELLQHSELANSAQLIPAEKTKFDKLMHIRDNGDILEDSLRMLSELLHKHYQQKVIVLIDEYDVPLDKAHTKGYYPQMIELIRGLLNQVLKTNTTLYFAVLTGCLRISKESIFTGMNNLRVNTISNSDCAEYFGFSDADVRKILAYYDLSDKYDTIRQWYDGYRFGNTEMYCPWDVLNYVSELKKDADARPKAYWINTSGNAAIRRFVDRSDENTKMMLESLIAGESVSIPIQEELTYPDIDNGRSMLPLWSLLYLTGYLTAESMPDGDYYKLKIPNLEIREIFKKQIYQWFQDTAQDDPHRISEFCSAIESGDCAAMQEIFTDYLGDVISIRDTYVQTSKKENFYHGILLGILSLNRSWVVKSNLESGDGYSDILIENRRKGIGAVIEVKYGENKNMEKGCRDALAQIEKMNYADILERDGIEKYHKYGIACYLKRCRVISG